MDAPEVQEAQPAYPVDSLYMPVWGGEQYIKAVVRHLTVSKVSIQRLKQPVAMVLGQRETYAFHEAADIAGIPIPSIPDFLDKELKGGGIGQRAEFRMGNFVALYNPCDLDDRRLYAGYSLNFRSEANSIYGPKQLRVRSALCSLMRPFLQSTNVGSQDATTLRIENPVLLVGIANKAKRRDLLLIRNSLHARNARGGKEVNRIIVGPLERYREYNTPQIR